MPSTSCWIGLITTCNECFTLPTMITKAVCQNPRYRRSLALFERATPMIEGHLKRAQDIQSKLGSGPTDTAKKGDTTKKP